MFYAQHPDQDPAPNVQQVTCAATLDETKFLLIGTWAGSWDEIAILMNYHNAFEARTRYEEVQDSLAQAETPLELEQNTVAELEAMIEKHERVLVAMKEELEVKRQMERVERKIQAEEEWLRREQDFLDGERERRVRESEEMRGTALKNLRLRVGEQPVDEDGKDVKVKVQEL